MWTSKTGPPEAAGGRGKLCHVPPAGGPRDPLWGKFRQNRGGPRLWPSNPGGRGGQCQNRQISQIPSNPVKTRRPLSSVEPLATPPRERGIWEGAFLLFLYISMPNFAYILYIIPLREYPVPRGGEPV